jgi:hypothetical protein
MLDQESMTASVVDLAISAVVIPAVCSNFVTQLYKQKPC